MNSFNQQFSPYSSIAGGYQWPSSSSQYMNQYSPLNSYMGSQAAPSAYSGLSGVQSQQGPMLSGLDSQSQGQSSLIQAANPSSSANNGLLSSASHLIAQYLSPTSAGSSNQIQQAANGQQAPGQSNQVNAGNAGIMTPQQQSQNQYSEFASILDSMVAQTGVSAQRQPNINQYLANQAQPQGQQGLINQQPTQGQQSAPGSMMIGDNDMSGSSNIQSYMPASPQQASQKSSMVSLAEQLAPGAQFNKLVSFPFSLSSNEDPSKEGRYKLHIPFLNQHVKRSDQQQAIASQPMSGQQQQNYLNSYYSQQQPTSLIANSQAISQQSQQQQQMKAQASQLIPTIVSPQSSSASSSLSSSVSQSQSYTNSQPIGSAISSPVSSIVSSSSSPSSSSAAAASPSVVNPSSSSS